MDMQPNDVTVLCLHGWGGSKESFTELRAALDDTGITIMTPDLPGFGEESEPTTPWTNDDYAEWVEEWMRSQKAESGRQKGEKLFVVGHSHGGRIAIKMAVRGNIPIDHLFLCAPAGIRHARHFKRMIGLTLAKTGKFFLSIPGIRRLQPVGKRLLYKLVRVHDYERASPVMRQTMINVAREDLRPLLPHISIPTDLFWGTDDRMTPYGDALIMEKHLKESRLHTFPGVRHGVHREKAQDIAEVVRKRLTNAE